MPSQYGVTFGQHNFLILSKVPAGQGAKLGLALKDAGSLAAGDYECEIVTEGAAKIEVNMETSAQGVAVTPSIRTRFLDGENDEAVAGVASVVGTSQEIAMTFDPGVSRAWVTFTVTDNVTFNRGEFNLL